MAIKGRANISLNSITDAIVQGTEPEKPTDGMLWLDNSQTPNVLKRYNQTSGQWEIQTVSVADADPDLKKDVDYAKDTADTAKNQASQAEALATEIQATADAANARADAASGRADDALTNANSALSQAQTAFDKATDASTKADAATGEISSVKQTVQGVQTTVQSKADKSEVTQLSNQLSTKISTVDADKKYATQSSLTQTSQLLDSTISKVDNTALAAFRNIRYVRSWSNKNTINSGNHWVEVEVYKDGNNLALGKTVTSSPTVSGLEVVTDGVIDTLKYVSIGADAAYVQIDLGQIYDTLDYAMVYRYWKDGRTYHDTKFEISTDGKTWFTVFDSKVAGEYVETEQGFRISLSQAEYIEKIATESSAFTQMVDNINLKVSKGDVINQINLDTSGVLIKGKNITLDGNVTVSSSFKVPKASITEIEAVTIAGSSFSVNDFTQTVYAYELNGSTVKKVAYPAKGTLKIDKAVTYNLSTNKTGADATNWSSKTVLDGNAIELSQTIVNGIGTNTMALDGTGITGQQNGTSWSLDSTNETGYVNLSTSGMGLGIWSNPNDPSIYPSLWVHGGSAQIDKGLTIASGGNGITLNGSGSLDNGVTIDMFGNVVSQAQAVSWNVRDADGTNAFSVPMSSRSSNYGYIMTPRHIKAGNMVLSKDHSISSLDGGMIYFNNTPGGTRVDIACKSVQQSSLLSMKENIRTINLEDALQAIIDTDVRQYNFKGESNTHTSFIIDDINDEKQYYADPHFLSATGDGRDDGNIVGYLMLAVKKLKQEIDELQAS
ncbi:TPA_asm: hypothetical protein GYP43_03110 [Listeria monocytogenes]|nr:hypothetical protein [Listeria monocytogenes]